jgi:hypothetical protein
MIGEFGQLIDDAPYLLEKLIDSFEEESAAVVRIEVGVVPCLLSVVLLSVSSWGTVSPSRCTALSMYSPSTPTPMLLRCFPRLGLLLTPRSVALGCDVRPVLSPIVRCVVLRCLAVVWFAAAADGDCEAVLQAPARGAEDVRSSAEAVSRRGLQRHPSRQVRAGRGATLLHLGRVSCSLAS